MCSYWLLANAADRHMENCDSHAHSFAGVSIGSSGEDLEKIIWLALNDELGTWYLSIFTKFGCPFVLKSDNGLCYTSREFHDFLEFYRIHHITSSPHYPQSNGFAEALVGISKKLMEKSVKDGKPWNHGLLEDRVTPVSGNLPSPPEALTGCRPRTSLPQILSCIGKSVETSKI